MGEYAKRKSDGVRIKIGTCEDLYYLRYEDRAKVSKEPNSLDPVREVKALRFRLPFPDEDNVPIGEYEDYQRGERLYRQVDGGCAVSFQASDVPGWEPSVGGIQLAHSCGLLVNVPCYHGDKLPSVGDCRAFWNGKSWFYELVQIRETETGVKPIVKCRHCGEQWRFDWKDIVGFIGDKKLRERLAVYINAEVNA